MTFPGLQAAESLALLRCDPRVAEAMLVPDGSGGRPSIVLRPSPDWVAAEMDRASASANRSLRAWETTYDVAYRKPDEIAGPSFAGWTSSFTREPIPAADMHDWLAGITARLLALPHAHVREIGCGTGLLVETVGPHCLSYEATDFSGAGIARLQDWLAGRPELAHVRAHRRAAHEHAEATEPVDLVIINSVAQHFPDAAYLRSVLDAAWRSLRPGGHIVIGDVRLLGLQPVFIAAVELARAPETMRADALRQAIQAAWLSQSELLIDPGLFHGFAHEQGGSVRVLLKAGSSLCEMTRYRCDVVLGKPASASGCPQSEPVELRDIAALRDWIARGSRDSERERGECAVLRGIANARLSQDHAAHQLIMRAAPATNVAELRAAVAANSDPAAIDPAEIEALAAAHGLTCELVAPPGAGDGQFDAWIGRDSRFALPIIVPSQGRPLTSQPLLMQSLRRLSTALHTELASRVAEAAMPARILPVLHTHQLASGDSRFAPPSP